MVARRRCEAFDRMLCGGPTSFFFPFFFFQRENILFFSKRKPSFFSKRKPSFFEEKTFSIFFSFFKVFPLVMSGFQNSKNFLCGKLSRLMVEQASNKTKNKSYSARQGVSQGQKPYTQTTFFSLRKFPFPRSTVSWTVWLRSAVSPRYARSDKRSALSDNLSYFPPISESETFSRKKKLVFVSVLPQGYTLSSSRNYYSVLFAICYGLLWND